MGKLVTALVSDLIMPIVGALTDFVIISFVVFTIVKSFVKKAPAKGSA